MKFLIVALLPAVALGQMLVGGISDTTVSVTYEPVQFAVDKVKDHLAATNGGQSQFDLLDIVKAKTQVVQGQLLYLTFHMTGDYYCNVTVWYRSWLQGSERLQVRDGPTCTKHQASARALGGLVGAASQPKPLGTGDDVVINALNFAVCADNDRSNNMFTTVLGDTSGVTYTEQVTSGMTYHFYNVPLVDSQCRKEGQCAEKDLTSCVASLNGMVVQGQLLYLTFHMTGDYYCNVTVWYRSWLHGSERLQVRDGPTCTKHQASARALGGLVGAASQPKPLGTGDDVVINALNFAVCADNDRSNNMFTTVLGDTSGVTYTEQVTSGMTYHFYNVPLVDSQCRKEGQCAEKDLTSCVASLNGMKRTCEIVVRAQLWMNPPYTLHKMTC